MPAFKDKKRGTWYANFYYKDWNGERKHKCKRGFKTQREAKEYERKFIDKLSQTSDISFAGLVENYINDLSTRLKPTTVETKKSIIYSKLVPVFGKMQVCDISIIAVRNWQNGLIKESGYAQTYLKTINIQLSAILNYAVANYGLKSNPCKVAGSIGKGKAEEMSIWTKDQFCMFVEHEKKRALHVAFDILFWTGIREGELLALTPADVLDTKKIDICKTFAKVDGQEMFLTPKTNKSKRKLSIPDFLYEEIESYIADLQIGTDERIFYFTKHLLTKEIKRVAKLAGLDQIRVHDLRHSHASLLISMKFDILEISRRLGHESVKTTWDTYSHLYPETDRELADRLDRFFEENDS